MHGRIRMIVIAGAVLLAAAGIYRLTRAASARNQIELLRDSVAALRTQTDACSAELRTAQTSLQRYSERLDSLHGRVRDYEADDPRGVPAARYGEYMDAFEQYRDSTAAWTGRVDTLQQKLEHCRVLAHRHNEAIDSLRAAYDRMK